MTTWLPNVIILFDFIESTALCSSSVNLNPIKIRKPLNGLKDKLYPVFYFDATKFMNSISLVSYLDDLNLPLI